MAGFFNKTEKDKTNAYLAGAAAATAIPTAYGVSSHLVDSVKEQLGEAGEEGYKGNVNYKNLRELKKEILKDQNLVDNLHVLSTPGKGYSVFSQPLDRSSYVPGLTKDKLKEVIQAGGFRSVDGSNVSVSNFIKGVRNTGGYISLDTKSDDIIDLAHELGHARRMSPTSSRYNYGIQRLLEGAGRTNPMLLAGAASVASLLQEDPTSPYVYAPALAVAATQAPVLREEYIASKKGYDALKKLESTGLVSKGTSALAKSKYLGYGGTYLAGAIGATATPALLALARQRYNTDVLKDAREGLSEMPAWKKALIGAGLLGGGVALSRYSPVSGFIDDLIGARMSRGSQIDKAVAEIREELSNKEISKYKDEIRKKLNS